uniref:Thioredoxin domain-containing protein n=1 Tax=Bicosoecida sp. CB-2014 TaxID=1486930 RepID=A0A7S1CD37_9STRA|mmetsp:Transcript_20261/g.71632  ORF Transcript_20261/g.71632 Transcript_20261/m.71632 type:complete len:228 (+) Transcript_20261:319-1002(+)
MAGLPLESKLPDFLADSQFGRLSAHDVLTGSWSMVFSITGDFDGTACTELGMIAKLYRQFVSRNCRVICISAGGIDRHEAFLRDVEETQDCKVKFPLVADESGALLTTLLMRKMVGGEPGHVLPSLVICDPDLTVQFSMVYPSSTGRNFYEVLRVIDSLQVSRYFKVATPAHWMAGEPVFVLPEVSDAAAEEMFPKGVTRVSQGEGRPACRLTPYPDVEVDDLVRDD